MASKVLIITARFNEMITKCLLDGALDTLLSSGIKESEIEIVWVPGAFEIPIIAAKAARTKKYGCIITLGAVIRGETPHFDFVAGEAARAIMDISVASEVPIIFGVLTTDTVEQALNRSGIKHGNKGRDAANAALSMMSIISKI